MLFKKIADGVDRHYKKIVIIWVVALLLAVPAVLQIGSVMDYQMDLGSGDDQESIRAQRIIEDNFQQSVANGTIMVLLQADDVTGRIRAGPPGAYSLFAGRDEHGGGLLALFFH